MSDGLVLTAGPLQSTWLHGRPDDERREIVETLLSQGRPEVFQLYMWDKPADGYDFPLVYLTIAVDGPVGAAHFYDHYAERNEDAAAVTVGMAADRESQSLMFCPEAGIEFPSSALVGRDELRRLMLEFVSTGQRPMSVTWQSVDFV